MILSLRKYFFSSCLALFILPFFAITSYGKTTELHSSMQETNQKKFEGHFRSPANSPMQNFKGPTIFYDQRLKKNPLKNILKRIDLRKNFKVL